MKALGIVVVISVIAITMITAMAAASADVPPRSNTPVATNTSGSSDGGALLLLPLVLACWAVTQTGFDSGPSPQCDAFFAPAYNALKSVGSAG